MTRIRIEAALDYGFPAPADVLLTLEVAQMPDQRLIEDRLIATSASPMRPIPGEEGIGRRTWVHAQGRFTAHYTALVDLARPTVALAGLAAAERAALPALVVPYLWPSRYCEADRFEPFVSRHFGHLDGGDKILAIADWIGRELVYQAGVSTGQTTAADTFVERAGVCRDYAHLMATMARAAGIPARCVAAYAAGLQPPDFHAVVEVWLDGGWQLVDATGLAQTDRLVRIAVGRDATDIAFMTIFGSAMLNAQSVSAVEIESGAPLT